MGLFRRKDLALFEVVVHLDGRHPYLSGHDLDYETRDVSLRVPARNWNDAERVALQASFKLQSWRYSVKSITRIKL
jgi:hypothetical protein